MTCHLSRQVIEPLRIHIDFGLSSLYEQAVGETDRATLLHTTCGTPNYVAPEVLADRGYDGAQADTWSIGVILFVFLAGFLPFDEATMSALFRKIQKADFTYPSWFQDDAKDLISKILVVDPKQRWSIAQIKQHPWWKKDGPYAIDDPTAGGRPPETAQTSELLDEVDEEVSVSFVNALTIAMATGPSGPEPCPYELGRDQQRRWSERREENQRL